MASTRVKRKSAPDPQTPPGVARTTDLSANEVAAQLSCEWTRECELLEAEARWKELQAKIELWLREPEGWKALPARWQACLARITAFVGPAERAREIIEHARARAQTTETETPDSLSACFLAEATLARFAHQWTEAEELAKSALNLARGLSNPHLFIDSIFALGLALTEQGRLYRALDHYQQIRNHPSATPFRSGLAAMNEGWTLWDIGQPQAMKLAIPRTPAPFQERMRIAVAMIEGDDHAILKTLQSGPDDSDPKLIRTAMEKDCIAQFVTEWWAVRGRELLPNPSPQSWLLSHLRERVRSCADPEQKFLLRSFEALLLRKSLEHRDLASWRNEIDFGFLEVLHRAQSAPSEASELYRTKLLPQLELHSLSIPTMPRWPELLEPSSAWSRHLARLLQVSLPSQALKPTSRPLLIREGELIFATETKELRFALGKSPVSRRLLMILAGQKGRAIRKSDIHRELTSSKYNPAIHDDRLHKLLRRLGKRIEAALGIRPWEMPGDNTVVLNIDLEIES